MSGVWTAVREYAGLGYETIPLLPGMKKPAASGWNRRNPVELWRGAPDSANIGIRFGGASQVAMIDCDEKMRPGTFRAVQSYLASLGYYPGDYPVIQTASGNGRHIYFRLVEKLYGDYRRLSTRVGAGEFRYGPGAFGVAPPSTVGDSSYKLLNGDFRQLPPLAVDDILSILSNQDTTTRNSAKGANISRRAMALLHGKHVENYASRSEAEQALITSLVNSGHDFNSILNLFLNYPAAGKFQELYGRKRNTAVGWLRQSYEQARQWTAAYESKARQTAAAALAWANSHPWSGKTGMCDRVVYIAHTTIALRAARLQYAASSRDLALLAGVARSTATCATNRLCDTGLLSLVKPAVADRANIYQIHYCAETNHSLIQNCEEVADYAQSDAFRRGGLGKTAGEIYTALRQRPMTCSELVERTGRHRTTVMRALERMAALVDIETGEIISMVERNGDTWYAVDVDPSHIAVLVGTAGKGEEQRWRFERERLAHQQGLAAGRKKMLRSCNKEQ